MKSLRKAMALLLAMVMVLAMGIGVVAAPKDTTLKVNAVPGHTYTAYQLFVGDLAEDGKTLSNVKWGNDVVTTEITYGTDKKVTPVVGGAVPQEVIDYLATLAGTATAEDGVAQDTADIIAAWVQGDGTVIPEAGLGVKTGYYVVKDAYADAKATQETTLSTIMCQVVGPTTITPKAGTVEHKKEVLDINDSTDVALDLTNLQNVADGWDKSADHDFGDSVPFKLTTKIGSDFAKYDNYYLAVNDTLKDGLVLNKDSIVVYVGGVKATQGTGAGEYSLTTADKGFKVEFTKLNGNTNAAAEKDVVVYYTATLDAETAVIGNPGNWNESYAEFSNNPNGTQEGTGKTPKDTAVVFTYQTVVDKVDEEKAPLVGAEFTLTKAIKDGEPVTIAVVKFDKEGKITTKTADGSASTEADATRFSFDGLDDGIYTLTETVTPNGYNTIDPVTFAITANHERVEATGNTELTVKNADGSDFDGKLEFTKSKDEGTLSTTVVNQKGSTLPSTGGIGTTIFYIVGGIIVAGAAILLIAKRKVNG